VARDVVKYIHWLGHDGFRLDVGGKNVYIDPFRLSAARYPRADLVLITHDHHDHYSPEDLQKVVGPATAYVTCQAVVAKGLKGDVHVVAPGDRVSVEGISVEAVRAYNVNKTYHPKAAGYLGFIVDADGTLVYHAGDTDVIPEMSNVHCNVALLPVSGKFVMTADEAVQAVQRIQPDLAIPMHYGAIIGGDPDARHFAEQSPIKTVILEPES
jgi:L-ascorbate metabolism protein UlaG (beta-lactamase superfamily)